MKKSLSKLLAAGICVAGIGTASAAWTTVSESTMAGFKNADVVKSFGFNSSGGLDLTDGFNKAKPNNEYNRFARYYAYGVTSATSYIKSSDGSYSYGSAGGPTGIYGLYLGKDNKAANYTFNFSASGVQSVLDKAKEKGYYKVRFVVDSLSHSDDGVKYTSEFSLGKQRAHYVDYTIPPTFSGMGIDSIKYNGVTSKYTTTSTRPTSTTNYVHSRDNVWLSAKVTGNGSVTYFAEILKTNYAKGATTTTTKTVSGANATVTAAPSGTVIKTYLGPNDSWVSDGDYNVKIRFCANTTKYTTLSGTAVTEKTCSDYVTVYVKNLFSISSENTTMGTVTQEYSNITIENGKGSFSSTATPKAGYVFNCWKNKSGVCVTQSNPLTGQSMHDTVLVASFKETPLTAEFYPSYRRYNGTVTSVSSSSTNLDFVVGKDSLVFGTNVKGASKALQYIVQYYHDTESTWKDLYWYYATASESAAGYPITESFRLNRDGTIKVGSAGTLVATNVTHGNSSTKFRMMAFYASATSYATAIAATKTGTIYSPVYTVNWKYPVTLLKNDGTTQISSSPYAYNATFTFPTNLATIGVPEDVVGKETYTYNWVNVNNNSDKPSTSFKVTAPVTYKVDLKAKYVVEFLDYDGSLWKNYNVDAYSACTTPANPNHKGNTTDYKFIKWDKTFTNITGYTTINAVYNYRVTFKGKDGATVLNNNFYAKGTSVTAPSAPAITGYVFAGWDKDFSNVTDSMTVTAKYVKIPEVEYTFSGASGGTLVKDVTLAPKNSCIIPNTEIDASSQGVHLGIRVEPALEGDYAFVNAQSYNIIAAFTVSQEGECANDDLVKDFIAAAAVDGVKPKVTVDGVAANAKTTATAATVLAEGVSFRYMFSAGNAFIITFLDADGETELQSSLLAEGAMPEAPETYTVPENNAHYTYTFAGWDPAVVAATANATYIAQIDSTVNEYAVTFYDDDDNEIAGSAQVIAYGNAAVAPATNPTKTGFVFTGWDEDIEFVISDLSVYPIFRAVPEVKFDADDMFAGANNISIDAPNSCFSLKNTVLWDAAEEEMLSLDPSFAMVKGESYVWKANVTMNTADACAENDLVKEILEIATYSDAVIPVKVNDIVANADIKANVSKFSLVVPFTAGAGKFTIVFAQADGTVIKEEKLEEGEMPSAPAASVIDLPENTAKNTYLFAGWDKEIAAVTENVTYTAVINEVVNKYTITFNYDEKTESVDYEYGSMPVIPEDLLACPEGSAEYIYECGWDKEIEYVTEAAVYTHSVVKAKAKYEVTYDFQPYNLKKETLEYGEMPEAPADFTCPEGSAFVTYECSWDKEFEAVTGEVTYTYVAREIKTKYEITYVYVDPSGEEENNVVVTAEIEHGALASTAAPAWECPEETDEFSYECSWNDDLDMASVIGEATYTYSVKAAKKSYTVTFKFGDKTESEEFEYGAMPTVPEAFKCSENTAEKSYTCKWDKEFAAVAGSETYTYTETATTNKYTITFKFGDKTETAEVEYGKVPSAPSAFKCSEKTDEYSYTCKWDKEFAKVTEKATYTYSESKSKNKYTITVSVNDSKMGEVTGLNKDGKYEYGTKVELVAKAADGYVFAGWADDKKAEAKRTITVSKDLKLEAKFEKKKEDAIIASAAPQFHMEVSGRDVAILGAKVGSMVAVLDMQGRVISKGRVDAANFSVTMPRAGMYIIRVNNVAKKVSVR